MSKEHEFALYSGENCIGTGTAKDLAAKRGVLPGHIRYLSTPAHQRRLARSKKPTGRAIYTIKLGPVEAKDGE